MAAHSAAASLSTTVDQAPAAPRRKTGRFTVWLLMGVLPLLPLQNIIDKIDTPLRGIPGVNFLHLAALFLVVAWVSSTLAKGRPLFGRARHNKVVTAYILLAYLGLWRAVGYVDAPPPISVSDPSFVFWKDYAMCFLMFFVTANTLDDEQTMRKLTALMFFILPYMCYVQNDNLTWASSWHYDDDMRVKGTMMHLGSNELAAFYVTGLLVALGLFITMRDLQWKLYLLGAAAMLGWGVVYSYSRSAYVAALAGIAVMGLLRSLKMTVILGLFLVVAPIVLPASVMDRFGMINSEQTKTDESTERRIELWDVAWKQFTENPILGTGYRSFPRLNRYNMDTHNMYLKLLCELGVMGFLLYLAQLFIGMRQGWLLSRYKPTPFAHGLGMGLLAASFAALVLNFFGDRSSYLAVTGYFWAWQGMGARILRAVEREGGWTR